MKRKLVKSQKTLTEKSFKALCSLFNDDSEETLELVSSQFRTQIQKEPRWKEWVYTHEEFASNSRIQKLLEEIRWDEIGECYRKLPELRPPGRRLEEGLYLLSFFRDPKIKRNDISRYLDQMAAELTIKLRSARNANEVIKMFVQYLFKKQGYRGSISDYYDPDNSYLNNVLRRRTGIPILLSAVSLMLAQRTRWRGKPIPLVGIGLPGHFIVQFRFQNRKIYCDPFSQGRILSRQDCIRFLRNRDIEFREAYLKPVDWHTILSRTITNLFHIYSHLGDEKKKNRLLDYLQILSGQGGFVA